jgi:uncharacterized repeat protein (TIGR03803 family)
MSAYTVTISARIAALTCAAIVLQPLAAVAIGDGSQPNGQLFQSVTGNLYGTASRGGTAGYGTIFEYTTGGAFSVLHNFGTGTDGEVPMGGLWYGPDGNLYGTTYWGGGSANCGTVYKEALAVGLGAYSIVHSFANTDGCHPTGRVSVTGTNSFPVINGSTTMGAANSVGNVYMIDYTGALTVLYNFKSHLPDSASPIGLETTGPDFSAGMAEINSGSRCQSIYATMPNGMGGIIESEAYVFPSDGGPCPNPPVGAYPSQELITDGVGNFYGDARNYCPDLFRYSSSGVSIIYRGCAGPVSGWMFLTFGSDGYRYGTSETGGTNSLGTVFRMTTGGAVTVLHSFLQSEGYLPMAPLLPGMNGNFYGTTTKGGLSGNGTLFEITPSGGLTVLHHFSG